MDNQHSDLHETITFVTGQEPAKLAGMLTLAVGDLERISGGCGCGSCCTICTAAAAGFLPCDMGSCARWPFRAGEAPLLFRISL
jgi:hypothetical protein